MKLQKLDHPPSSPSSPFSPSSVADMEEGRLRNHLQNALNKLPNDLPKYNKEQLLGQYSPHMRSSSQS
jgi:hypothetical protein